ncbi:MAG: hypothetical protein JXR88_04990 [Clostridia bacterium]|nr:hypothetical protein [Clostridia bacterium]
MYPCPNCHEKTIGFWKKFLMGPARSTSCSNCGAQVSTSYWSLMVIPFLSFFLVYMARFFETPKHYLIFLWSIVCITVTLMGILNPLIVKPEIKTKKYHIKNMIIIILYMTSVLSIPLYYLDKSNPVYVDDRLAVDYNIIQSRFSHLLEDLTEHAISKAYGTRAIQSAQDHTVMGIQEISELAKNPPQTNLLSLYPWLIEQYDPTTGLSEEAISLLKALIALDATYGGLSESSTYEMPINPFIKVSLPPLGVKYFEAVDALLLKYGVN